MKEEPAAQVMAADGEGTGGVERKKVMVEYRGLEERREGGSEDEQI